METLVNNLIQATGWSILHSLWQGALIYALLLPSQLNVFKLNAKLKYKLAYVANCLMFICFVCTFISVFHWPSASAVSDMPAAFPAIATPIFIKYAERLFPALVLLYLIGLLIQSVIVVQGYKKVNQLKKANYSKVPEEWAKLFQNLTRNMNIRKHIDFRLSDHVNVPLVIGFLKPVILFPVALAAQMELNHVEAILIHELSHIRRNDYLFNLIRTMIDTVLFFNPFIWLTGKFIDIEREHACDDLVVKLTDQPLTYAHALLKLELLTDKHSPVLALAATGTNQHLYQRIKRITDMKTNYMNSKQKLFTVTLTLATIVSLAWISPEKNDKPIKKVIVQNNVSAPLYDLSPLDTAKKKIKKGFRVPPPPPVEPKSKMRFPPPPPPVEPVRFPPPPAPVDPKVHQPEAPEAPEMPELSKAITDFSIKVQDMVMAGSPSPAQLEQMKTEIERSGVQLQKQFNTPEQKAKWEKYGKEMQARYNSPEQKAKWDKYAQEMQAKSNSPEQKAKWDKFAKEIEARYNTPEQRAKLEKYAMEMQAMYNSPEQRKHLAEMQQNAQLQMKVAQKAMAATDMRMQDFKFNVAVPDVVFTETDDQQKIKQSPEYIELKKKFDKDVEELANKKLKKGNN
ncbi:M56 family metallopeptidase [Pedobacter sp. L105]|uniref:M56 family metallopeptidase n=1 Tax=Pedobacter sp. L105 TaxID=1641871 RepID=UPI00131B2DC9|nr:M56 family metallopeptidase [Pedobacter sp. L105]